MRKNMRWAVALSIILILALSCGRRDRSTQFTGQNEGGSADNGEALSPITSSSDISGPITLKSSNSEGFQIIPERASGEVPDGSGRETIGAIVSPEAIRKHLRLRVSEVVEPVTPTAPVRLLRFARNDGAGSGDDGGRSHSDSVNHGVEPSGTPTDGSQIVSPPLKRVIVEGVNLQDAYLVSFKIRFDERKFFPVSVRTGKALDEDKNLLFALLNRPGEVPVAIARIRPDENGLLSGSGEILAIDFGTKHSHGQTEGGDRIKLISAPPSQDPNNIIDLYNDLDVLVWQEARWGDWNNDGYVKADDVVPLAWNYGKNADPASPDYYKYTTFIDGNKDGIVDAGDISPIAAHFGESTAGYNIYEVDDPATGTPLLRWQVPRPEVPDDPQNSPTLKSFATLEYRTDPRALDLYSGWWYRVSPDDPLGEPTVASSPWVQYLGTAAGWEATLLDTDDVSTMSAALDLDGNPAVLYTTRSETRLARFNGVSWSREVVISGDWNDYGAGSLSFSPKDGYPSFLLGDSTEPGVIFMKWNGSSWVREVVDSGDTMYAASSLTYDKEANPIVAYYYYGGATTGLRFARRTESGWTKEVIQGGTGILDVYSDLKTDPKTGEEAVAFRNASTNDLRFSRRDSATGKWNTQTVDSEGYTGMTPKLAFGPSGPAIAYYVGSTGLKYAWWESTVWNTETIAGATGVPLSSGLQFYSSGEPATAYDRTLARRTSVGWKVELFGRASMSRLLLNSNDQELILCVAWSGPLFVKRWVTK